MNEERSPLRCECRRPPPFERGVVKWSFALLILAAAALDAFWVMPAQRAARERRAHVERLRRCADVQRTVAQPAPTPAPPPALAR